MYDKSAINTLMAFLYFRTLLQGQYYGYYHCLVKQSYFLLLEVFHNFRNDLNYWLRMIVNGTIELWYSSRPVLWIYLSPQYTYPLI